MNASLTGHLVLSTIHTNSAAGAIPRMTDMGVEPFLLVSTVKTIIAQRLVRKLTNNKEKYFLSKDELKDLSKVLDLDEMLYILKNENIVGKDDEWKDIAFYRPVKSIEFVDGYSGRIGIHEILKVTNSIKEMIIGGSSEDKIAVQARKEGMITILQDGIYKAVQGQTSLEEVLRVVSE